MEYCVIYNRLSKKTKASLRLLKNQEDKCREYAQTEKYEILGLTREICSAYLRQGPSFNHEVFPWENVWVIVSSVDRFSRTALIGSEFAYHMIREKNCGIISIKDGIKLTETSGKEWQRFNELLSVAESKPKKLSQLAFKKNKKALLDRFPYGFKDVNGTVPEEKEQEVKEFILSCKEEKTTPGLLQTSLQQLYSKHFNEFDDDPIVNYKQYFYNHFGEFIEENDPIYWMPDKLIADLLNAWNIESPVFDKWTPDMIEYVYNPPSVPKVEEHQPVRVQPRRACRNVKPVKYTC
jgi:DNA invertase Pin-like site-specific DNA recombinase